MWILIRIPRAESLSKADTAEVNVGEAEDGLDRTVSAATVNSLALPEWMAEFERLKKLNAEIVGGKGGKPATKKKQSKVGP